jgi:ABC-2 type transport system permease protein
MRLKALLKKETKTLANERAYLLTVIFQLFIVVSIVQLVRGYVAITYSPIESTPSYFRRLPVAVVDINDTALLGNLEGLNLRNVSGSEAQSMLEQGRVFAVVTMNGSDVSIVTDQDSILSGITISRLSGVLEAMNRQARADAVEILFEPVHPGPVYEYAYPNPIYIQLIGGLIVPFVLLIPLFVSMSVITDSMIGEKEKKTLENLLVAPIKNWEIVLGKLLPTALLAVLQSFVWLAIVTVQGVPIFNLWAVAILVIILSFFFVETGILFSAVSSNLRQAGLLNAAFGIIITILLLSPVQLSTQLFNLIPSTVLVKTATNIVLDIQPYIQVTGILLVTTFLFFLLAVQAIERQRR